MLSSCGLSLPHCQPPMWPPSSCSSFPKSPGLCASNPSPRISTCHPFTLEEPSSGAKQVWPLTSLEVWLSQILPCTLIHCLVYVIILNAICHGAVLHASSFLAPALEDAGGAAETGHQIQCSLKPCCGQWLCSHRGSEEEMSTVLGRHESSCREEWGKWRALPAVASVQWYPRFLSDPLP